MYWVNFGRQQALKTGVYNGNDDTISVRKASLQKEHSKSFFSVEWNRAVCEQECGKTLTCHFSDAFGKNEPKILQIKGLL